MASVLLVVAVLSVAMGGTLVALSETSVFAASGPTVTLQAGPYTNGENITVSGTGFPSATADPSGLSIIECADTGGTAAGLPTDDTSCDGTTVNPLPITQDANGDFSTVYMLNALSPPSSNITCDANDFCVLWVGVDFVNAFQSNFAFSAPFEIGGSGTTSTTTTSTTTTSPSSTTTTSPSSTTTTTGNTGTTTTTSTSPTSTTTTSPSSTTTTSPSSTTTTTGNTGTTTTTSPSSTTTTSATRTPITVASTLSGGGQSGGTIVVPSGTAVTDQATLSGPNASSADGTLSYVVLSSGFSPFRGFLPFGDDGWDNWFLVPVADAGTVTVSGGTVPASNAVTFGTGIYFWVAHYGGDAVNAPSSSTTGVATEIMQAPTTCPVGFGWVSVRCFAHSGGGGTGTGNSGTGNSGTGNSGTGNSGSGNSGTGNSGTGNSGTGNSGSGFRRGIGRGGFGRHGDGGGYGYGGGYGGGGGGGYGFGGGFGYGGRGYSGYGGAFWGYR